ncbi:MAG TPA: response regulator [Rhodanobacteraceae bacterium]
MPAQIDDAPITAFDASVLVAEDDAPSRLFLQAALERLGCRVSLAEDGAQALEMARQQRFDLLLLDCRMPHAGAIEVLTALRGDPAAASRDTDAAASSAELDASIKARLASAGFADALPKPTTLAAIRTLAEHLLPSPDGLAAPLLDNATAYAHGGTADVVDALRGLFARDLRLLSGELPRLSERPADLAERLHRLLASCGFCGANALANACRRLKNLAENGARPPTPEVEHFRHVLLDTIRALDASVRCDQRVADPPNTCHERNGLPPR